MTGPELKAIEEDLLAEVLLAFQGAGQIPGDDPDGNWPVGMCDSTCEALHVSEVFGGYGWGEAYGLHVRSGGFYGDRASGHTWLQADDGTIVDPTIGQFIPGPALRVVAKDDPLYVRYSWPRAARAEADEFVCDSCKKIFDIEDSVRVGKSGLLCEACSLRLVQLAGDA